MDDTIISKTYRGLPEHYVTAIIFTRPHTQNGKTFVEGPVGVVSIWIIAALRNQQFCSFSELNEAIWEKLYAFNHKPFQKKSGQPCGRV
jgi:hypothetical protein